MAERPSPLRRILPGLLTAVALAALGGFLAGNHRHIAEKYVLNPLAFFVIVGLVLAILALRGLANRTLFKGMGVEASVSDWFRLVTVSSFTNYLPLSAGLAVKAFILNRVYKTPYRLFAVGQTSLLIIFMSTNGAVGLATLSLEFPGQVFGIIGAGFAVMTGSAALLFLPDAVARLTEGRKLPGIGRRMSAIRSRWGAVAALQVFILLMTAAMLKISFDMGPAEISFAACIVFTAAGMLTRVVSITPGGIGIRELVVGGLAYLVGFGVRDAVIASALVRIAEVAALFTLGSLLTYGISRRAVSPSDE